MEKRVERERVSERKRGREKEREAFRIINTFLSV